MAKPTKNTDLAFLDLVARAAFSNPFSAERDAVDRLIAGLATDRPQDELLAQVIKQVHDKVYKLQQLGHSDLSKYTGRERELHEALFLFDSFHAFMNHFDQMIEEQGQAGDEPVEVKFAPELLQHLESYGMSPRNADRMLAIFFQLRRAYYFITRLLGGRSPSMQGLKCQVWNSIFTLDARLYEQFFWNRMEDFSTLILGETGCGKGNVAAAIGRSSFVPFERGKRRFATSFTSNFLAINISQFPETLLESELFGHRKGSFTGAVDQHEGAFGRCPAFGAIFIDEVGDIPVHVQIKLLRVLQERLYTKVGGQTAQRFAGRVLAATNKPLLELRQEGAFRDDFYYRLSADVIRVPTLRQRLSEDPAELDLLLTTVVRQIVGESASELVAKVQAVLKNDLPRDYGWPGNVRELEQAVRRIILSGHYYGDTGDARDLGVREDLQDHAGGASLEQRIHAGDMTAADLMRLYCRSLYSRLGTLEAVAERLEVDPRTVKKHLYG